MTTSISISSCFENPQSALSNAFQRRNVDAFKFALEHLRADPNTIDSRNDMSIFEDVLMTPNSVDFINLCIDNGADLYVRNPHGRYPLSYAIDSLSPRNLRAFLKSYDLNKINVKYGHKNSLHMLMELLPTISPEEYQSLGECIKILVENGCDVNMPDEKSRTPFYMLLRAQAKRKEVTELVDFIIKFTKVDLYTYKSKEMVDMFNKFNPHHELPERVEKIIDLDYMLSLLRKRDENEFISHYRVFKENETNKHKVQENEENKSNIFAESCAQLLYTAIENNLENVVEHLVDEGVDVTKKAAGLNYRFAPALLACSHGNYRILEMLLRAEPKPELVNDRGKNLLHIATEHFGMDPSTNPSFNYDKCFYLALDHCDVNQQDDIGFTPLHYSARYRNEKAVLALLRKGSYVGTRGFNNETPIDNMCHESLEAYLDECISTNQRRSGDEEQQIIIDYNFLMAPRKTKGAKQLKAFDEFGPEIAPLENISEHTELRPLIRHPVLASFLFLKWTKLTVLFHANLLMFSLFMLSLIYYIVLCQSLTPKEQDESALYACMKVLSVIGLIMLLLREIFQFILSWKIYLKSMINYFEIALIILGFVLIFQHTTDDDPNKGHLRILRAVTILFAAYEFLQLVGTLPYFSISTHMVILKKVAVTFLKSLILYSILLLAFALCFYSLFGGRKEENESNGNSTATEGNDNFNSFGYPGIAIIKTFVMLTGEFDASELALDQNEASYSIIFLLFVFLITIVLFNLLNALAIDDTQQIREEGELVDLVERIKVLRKYEKIILSQSGSWYWLKKYISIFPHTVPHAKIVILPDKNNEILTYRHSSSTRDVSIEMANENELIQLNNNLTKSKIIPTKISDTLIKYSEGMAPKIMKRIQKILEERKKANGNHFEELSKRFNSMESEIKILKNNIENLTSMLCKKFNP